MTVLSKNLTANSLVSQLVSVNDLVVGGSSVLNNNYDTLVSRLKYQSAVPGVTTFQGVVQANSFPALSSVTMDTSSFNTLTPITVVSFNGFLNVTGTLTSTQFTQTMPANLTSSFVGVTALDVPAASGGVNLVFGKAVTTNNCGVIQWDVTNTRALLALANSSVQTRISSTEVNMVATSVFDASNNPYQAIRNSNTVTLNIASGGVTANGTFSISATNVRQVFLSLTNIKFSAANALLQLQAGQSTTWINATAGTYNGVTTTQQMTDLIWTNTGIYLTGQYASATAIFNLTVKLTRLEIVGGRQAWSVEMIGGSENLANAYFSGSGSLLMQSAGATSLTSLRLLSTGAITTGSANLYVA